MLFWVFSVQSTQRVRVCAVCVLYRRIKHNTVLADEYCFTEVSPLTMHILFTPWSPSLQAMHLVYRAMEKEVVPATLPSSLIPPSKRKKIAGLLPGSVAVLPSSPFMLKDSLGLRPTTSTQGRQSPLGSSGGGGPGSLSPKHSFKSSQPPQVKYTHTHTHTKAQMYRQTSSHIPRQTQVCVQTSNDTYTQTHIHTF